MIGSERSLFFMKQINKQMEKYLNYCEKVRGMSETTLRQKQYVLMLFVKVTEISRIENLTNEMFNYWISERIDKGVSAESLNSYNSIVVALVRYHRELGVVVPLNLTLIKKIKGKGNKRLFYTANEILSVVDQADCETGLMIRIMFETGMRIAELTRLRIDNFDGRRVRFVGKGKKMREVYVTDATLALMSEYVMKNGVTGYLWSVCDDGLTCNGEPPTINTIRTRLKQAFERAGFSGFYPHALRHSFATNLQLKGASVAEIKEMIGHSSVATTERYLHGFEGRLEELFDKYW